jgi:DNA-binding MarR family transcriptional regulator
MKESSDSEIINKLILNGGLEVSAMDQDTGEILYSFTPKIKELMPDLYEEHIQTVNQEVMNLWEKGFLEMDLFQSDPIITITEKALNKKYVDTLSKQEQWSLLEIIRLLKRKV